jgi:hypothetical protein
MSGHTWDKTVGLSGGQNYWRCPVCRGEVWSKKKPPPNQKVPIFSWNGKDRETIRTKMRLSCDELQVYRVMAS